MPRFHAIARPGGTVERVQFTPAEEAARDAQEAAWAAGQATRDANEARIVQREVRIKQLAIKDTMTRAEQDEFIKLLAERER